MPNKEGSEDKTTKSVVSKKQKQMMGEEGYDVARDQGKVRPSKDKKDATTMPVSKEIKKTRKVNKGPSALELVKKKYKGQIMDELDLSKVAESFGGYIISEQEFSDRQKSNMKKLLNKNFGSKEQSKETAGKLIKDTAKKDVEKVQSGRTVKKTINPNVSKGSGDGIKKKKVFSGDKSGAYQATKSDIEARKGFAGSKTTDSKGNVKKISGLKDDERNKYVKREVRKTRQDSQKGDILKGDIYDAPKVTDKDYAKSLKDVRKAGKGTRDAQAQAFKDIKTAGGSLGQGGDKPAFGKKTTFDKSTLPKTDFGKPTIPRKKKTFTFDKKEISRNIPKDTGSSKDVGKTKKRFSQMSKDIKNLKIDKESDKFISKVGAKSKGGGAVSGRAADFSGVSRQTGKMKSGPKVVKQLGRSPKLGGSVVKVVGKETQKAAAKTAAKQITKTAGQKALKKGLVKGVAKQIPGVGAALAGAEAGYRALKGDFKGAALSAGEAIPGLGLGFTAANVARDVSRAKKAASAVKTVTKAKRVKDIVGAKRAVKVVTPTVVGTQADKIAQAKKKISTLTKSPEGKAAVIGGSALATSKVNRDLKNFKVPTEKGGRTGFRSAK